MTRNEDSKPRRSQRLQRTTPQESTRTSRSSNEDTRKRRPKGTVSDRSSPSSSSELIHEDDLCPICHLLLHPPVLTTCNHTLCQSCFTYWAETSLSQQIIPIVDIDDRAFDFSANDLEAKCPMCRTLTRARLDHARAHRLKAAYPRTWEALDDETRREGEGAEKVQTVTLYIGNSHREVEAGREREDGVGNRHEWDFFVRCSRVEVIEEVQFLLHPTFRPSRVIRQRPPFEISRLGWGTFTLTAYVVLKAGFSWCSSDAEDSPDGASKGMLPLEWTLDFAGFGGKGSMGKYRLKVKHDREWEGEDHQEARDAAEWQRTVRQYQRDGIFAADEEDE